MLFLNIQAISLNTMTESMAEAGTNVFVIGGGEGSSMVTSEYVNQTMLDQGFPRWDMDVSRKDVATQSDIDGIAGQEGLTRRPPMAVVKLSIKGNAEPEFGSYNLGDTCRININDARNPSIFVGTKRLVKWELHPQSGESMEEASLTFEGDPDA